MTMEINAGDIVKIPQNVLLISIDLNDSTDAYYKVEKPMAAIYLGDKYYNGKCLKELLLDSEIWYAEQDDIFLWREHASKND